MADAVRTGYFEEIGGGVEETVASGVARGAVIHVETGVAGGFTGSAGLFDPVVPEHVVALASPGGRVSDALDGGVAAGAFVGFDASRAGVIAG